MLSIKLETVPTNDFYYSNNSEKIDQTHPDSLKKLEKHVFFSKNCLENGLLCQHFHSLGTDGLLIGFAEAGPLYGAHR